MMIYVHKLTRVIAFKALRANGRTTLSSGAFRSIGNCVFARATPMLLFRHIDGHDYFYALSEMLDSARECIFILVCVSLVLILSVVRVTIVKDWWLTPELYLRRPPAYHPEWRLDRILQRKAQQGVKIYVVVYKEVRITTIRNALRHQTLTYKRLPKL
jgi:phosphatidylserine/phosphatidylglycerophosphate/cardiolipin synthase-like enzyme